MDRHREQIPADAADGLRVPLPLREAGGHLLEHLIAPGHPQGVVDQLEAIDVDEGQRHPLPFPRRGEEVGEPLLEQGPVGEPRQRIVEREVVDALVLRHQLQRKRDVDRQLLEQPHLFPIKEPRLGGMQHHDRNHLALHGQGKAGGGAGARGKRPLSVSALRARFQVVGDHGVAVLGGHLGQPRGPVGARQRRQLQALEEAPRQAPHRHGLHVVGLFVDLPDPGGAKTALPGRNAGHSIEQPLTVANADDGGVDTAQHLADAAQPQKPQVLLHALGDVAGNAIDANGRAIRARHGSRPVVNPADAALRPHDAVLEVIDTPGKKRLPRRRHALPVLRVHRLKAQVRPLRELLRGPPEQSASRRAHV